MKRIPCLPYANALRLRSAPAWAKALSALLLSVTTLPLGAQDSDDLLEPERAFAFSTEVVSPEEVAVTWDIAPGYYMYLDKFRFDADPAGAAIAQVNYPPAKPKHDEFFGDIQILEHSARITLALERSASDSGALLLSARGQGCNEPVGVCYPPITHTVTLALAETRPPASSTVNSVADLQQLLGVTASGPEFLDVDEAFDLRISADGRDMLRAQFTVAPGYYLYRDKVNFVAVSGAVLSEHALPEGKREQDPYFGEVDIYPTDFAAQLPIIPEPSADEVTLIASFQGCAEQGICYPPVNKTVAIALPRLISEAAASEAAVADTALQTAVAEAGQTISTGALLGYLGAAFGTGLLLSFTPCVLPLIPILLGTIVGQSGTGRGRAMGLSVVYVLGTVATYAVIGAVAGATGEQLQAYFQNIWAIGAIALVLGLMALSMFGFYEIQMPSALQSRLTRRSRGLGGSAGIVFILGAASALIVGACVSPLLISVLSIAILNADLWIGAALMSAMALGMGVILIVAGAGATWLIPRSGPWMERVKQAFGVMLLGAAIYLLGAIPAVPVLLLWAALFIITGVFLSAGRSLASGASGWTVFFKGLGTVLLVWGVLAMIGGFSGSRSIMAPVSLSGFIGATGETSEAEVAHFERVDSLLALDQALGQATASGEKVVLDFYADWCSDCVRMENTTFQDPAVTAALEGYRLLQVDVTDPDGPGGTAIKKRYGVFGPPAMLFFNAKGREYRAQRRYGFIGADALVELLNSLE
ncbi:MAG TPA: thiol:disulfide interchange protein [Gammaproteobacteria bacterium]|nr:protein-disulfide reductase DsbD [Arenicellales bacterium]MDP6792210.1 protein-disulfide reductase DsbD [Arenicellales bacterium]MDP6919994.1 protein-disulfide reductase DsbD [Arenicellales bacterium]HCX88838.1 thiol:disulfide interchange protein [Gammaproteobacteria bacterium]